MELRARLFPLGDGTDHVLASLLPADALVFQSARCAVDLEDPVFRRILEAGERVGGFWVSGEAIFSAAELRTLTHFELVCRSVVRETDRDFKANDAVRKRTPPVNTGGEAPIYLLAGLFLSQIRMKPNMVGSIGDWTAEYVIGSAVAQALKQARFTGVSLLPITNLKTGVSYAEYFQIFSDALLPAAVVDCSVERIRTWVPGEDGRLRHLGCLSYERSALLNRPDFNRTAEPWAGWHGWPSWVVSAGVMEMFKKSKLRGWHFRPVLTTDSELYSQYFSKWSKLREAVGATTMSKMDGGRW